MSTVKTNNVQVGQSGTATNNFTLYQPTSPDGTVRLGVGNSGATTADVLIANSGGTVGVGVTPNTWGSPITKAFQVGNASVSNYLTGNAYYNSGWKYVVTKAASMYQFEGLNHTWSSAASGTAGTAITFTDVLAVSKDKSLALQGATTQSGTGITFPATQSASSNANTLDDYEEGTWTPTIKFGGNSTGMTYTTQLGTYIKIGRTLIISMVINLSAKGSSTGDATISNLPFSVTSNARGGQVGANYSSFTNTVYGIGYYADGTTVELVANGLNGSVTMTQANFTDSSAFRMTGVYIVD